MKRIGVFLTHEPRNGGMFQYCQTMLEAVSELPKDKFSVVVGYTSDLWVKYLKDYNFETVFVQKGFWARAAGRIWRDLGLSISEWRKIASYFHPAVKALLKEKCDLWIFPSQSRWNCQIPVPALATIHDLMHRYECRFPEVADPRNYREIEWLSRNACACAKGIIVDSEVGKKHVQESYGLSENVYVLPYIAPKYIHSQHVPYGFDARYTLPKKFIFYPAQFWKHKNHKNLIAAVGRLKREISDLKLVLIGTKKNAYDQVLAQIRDLNLSADVVVMGYAPEGDIPELYRRARALVMPTYFGPTNIPQLEAFVAGCPVATSRIYGIPEQVGDAALLFDPDSVEEIAACIKRLWLDDDLCRSLVTKGKLKAAAWGQKEFNVRVREIIEQAVAVSGESCGIKEEHRRAQEKIRRTISHF